MSSRLTRRENSLWGFLFGSILKRKGDDVRKHIIPPCSAESDSTAAGDKSWRCPATTIVALCCEWKLASIWKVVFLWGFLFMILTTRWGERDSFCDTHIAEGQQRFRNKKNWLWFNEAFYCPSRNKVSSFSLSLHLTWNDGDLSQSWTVPALSLLLSLWHDKPSICSGNRWTFRVTFWVYIFQSSIMGHNMIQTKDPVTQTQSLKHLRMFLFSDKTYILILKWHAVNLFISILPFVLNTAKNHWDSLCKYNLWLRSTTPSQLKPENDKTQ